jgi:CBS domain-containing protein
MGQHDVQQDEARAQAFKLALLNDLEALQTMLDRGLITDGTRRIGAEQEMFLVDSALRPANVISPVLARLNHPQFTTEIGKFNLELNLSPRTFSGPCLREMEAELHSLLGQARAAAREQGAEILLAGTLPTAHQYHLGLDSLTPNPRYLELNRIMTKLRGPNYPIVIEGIDSLHITHDNVMAEACCASFQVHFQVSPSLFAPVYNLAQMVSGPVLAAAVNSPLLLGQRLWHETRIALFQHSVDARSKTNLVRGDPARVSFGNCWVEQSVIEVFREEIARFRVIMTSEVAEDSMAVLEAGGIPELRALRLHNGTVWRWNRPCYGIMNGQAHLRIEARALPAGPSVLDEIANAAFLFGLLGGMAGEYGDIRHLFPFDDAKNNFYRAARYGLNVQFAWLGGRHVPAGQLILEELLPLARAGLRNAGICSEDIDRYLGVIEERVRAERTGSQWALQSLAEMGAQGSREARHRWLTAAMLKNQQGGEPVHRWPLAEFPGASEDAPAAATVEDCMSTELFTVHPDDLLRLAANLMDWRQISHVPVEDDEGRLVGLVTYRTLIRVVAGKAPPGDLLVRDQMQTDFAVALPETPLREAMEIMRLRKTDCLPVVVGDRLVGLLTSHDLLSQFAVARENPAALAAGAS